LSNLFYYIGTTLTALVALIEVLSRYWSELGDRCHHYGINGAWV